MKKEPKKKGENAYGYHLSTRLLCLVSLGSWQHLLCVWWFAKSIDGGYNPKMQDQTRLLLFPRPFIFGMHSPWGFNLHIKSYIESYIVGKRSLVGAKLNLASAKRFLFLYPKGLLWNPLILIHFQPAFRFER